MAQITVDVDWEIQPPRETNSLNDKRFDTWRQSDQSLGPQPDSPPEPPPETDGR